MASGPNNSAELLSIIIPTYNRRERLVNTLSKIFKQDLACVKNVIVIDNCSDYDIFELPSLFKNEKLKIIRNPFNIGMASNVANTFRYCETEWMWLLSDDDEVNLNSITLIHETISLSEDLAVIKFLDIFSERINGVTDFTIQSLEAFIDYYKTTGSHGELIFMSNNIYNTKKLAKYMNRSFTFAYSYIPQIILLMSALNSGELIKMVNSKIITYKEPEPGNGWIPLDVFLGISTINHIPFKLSSKYRKKLLSLFLDSNIGATYHSLICNYSDFRLHQYKLIYYNYWKFSLKISDRIIIKILTCSFIVKLFRWNLPLLNLVRKFYKTITH